MTTRRLYRCRTDRKIAGVASGIAEYFELDPTAVRVAWIVSVLFGGFTIPLYVILAIVMPSEPLSTPVGRSVATDPATSAAGMEPSFGADAAAATGEAGEPVGPIDAALDASVPASTALHAHARAGSWTPGAVHEHRAAAQPGTPGRTGLVVGILLVVFGAIALVGQVLPGWVTGVALGPAFILALGIALVFVASRRTTAPL